MAVALPAELHSRNPPSPAAQLRHFGAVPNRNHRRVLLQFRAVWGRGQRSGVKGQRAKVWGQGVEGWGSKAGGQRSEG